MTALKNPEKGLSRLAMWSDVHLKMAEDRYETVMGAERGYEGRYIVALIQLGAQEVPAREAALGII
jgi:hypothetical protein